MRHLNSSGPLFLSILVLASTALHAQAPAAGTSVSVKMIDTVNSGSDPAGKQYRASVTTAVTAANGVTIAQGAAATVTLASSGADYTAQLSSITINGQSVAVTSNSASVSAVAQYAQAKAASAVGSVLGGFGHHVSAPASVAAAATSQHVSLPTGTTLTFVLGASPAAPAAPAAAPAAQPMTALAEPAPAPASSPAATSSVVASGSVPTLVVCYTNINALYLSAAFDAPADRYSDATLAFSKYLEATYHYSFGVKCLPIFTIADAQNAQKQLAGFAAQLKPIDTGWRLGQPPVTQGQSGFDPLAQGPGGIDLSQHRLTTYFCTQTAPGGTTMAVDLNQPNRQANEITYVSQVFQADWDPAPVSMAYKVYIRDNYVHDFDPTADLSPRCGAQSPAMQTMQHQSAMISNKRTGKSVGVDFTYSPAQAGAAAAAPAAPPKPAAAGHQHYVYCISGANMPVVYFSEVFAATTTSDRVGPSPAPNRYIEIADPFKAFLDKKYGAQSNATVPPTCRVTNPDPAGLQAAQKAKQGYEDMYKQQYKKEIVETGWKGQ